MKQNPPNHLLISLPALRSLCVVVSNLFSPNSIGMYERCDNLSPPLGYSVDWVSAEPGR